MRDDFDREWQGLAVEILSGMKEWRLAHPKATLDEIEAALDERLTRLRARVLQDAALASEAADAEGAQTGEARHCAQCGVALEASSAHPQRLLRTSGGQRLTLRRRYWQCPACGAGFFPPRR